MYQIIMHQICFQDTGAAEGQAQSWALCLTEGSLVDLIQLLAEKSQVIGQTLHQTVNPSS